MRITLSKEALGSLPAPDSQGLVRVQATLSIGPDGTADLMEINDSPVGEDEGKTDDAAPMPAADVPDLSGAPSGLY